MMAMINVYTYREKLSIPINEEVMNGSVQNLKKYVVSIIGYSSRISLYNEPLSTFSRLDFISSHAIVRELVGQFGQICITFNNRQHIEEPDFNDPPPKSTNDLLVVAQTCNENIFSFDRYKIDSKTCISFLKSLTSRIGQNVHILFYSLRIPLSDFSNEESLQETIAMFAYHNRTVIITADEQPITQQYREVRQNSSMIDYEQFYLIRIEEEQKVIVMSREADWKVVVNMLSIIFNAKLQLKHQQSITHSQISKTINEVILVKQTASIRLAFPIQMSFFVGKTSSYLVFLQKSSILHIYSHLFPFQHINTTVLCSDSCDYLYDDIPVLLGEQLLMYNITITCITLKYYTLPLGQFKYVQHFKWSKQYGQVRVDTLDIISVNFRGNKIRIFYVYEPNQYLQLPQPDPKWFVFVSKLGYSILSDRSGIIALSGITSSSVNIYNLLKKQKIALITLKNLPSTILSISFDPISMKALISNVQRCYEYTFGGEVNNAYEKESKALTHCYSPQGKIFKITPNTFQWLNSPQLRIKDALLITPSFALSFNPNLQPATFASIYTQRHDDI